MVEYTNDDAKIFDHINNVLVGEFPSFGIAKESKFQQLMQRNQSYDASQQPLHASQSEMLNYNKYDTSLSVEAKAFQPSIAVGNQFSQQAPMPGILPPFANLDISGSSGGPTARPPMGSQPNPSAHEFIPRNMSAPVLNPHNGGFSIPEFIPNHPMARPNGPQAQTPSFIPTTQQPTSYLMQQTIATAPDAHMRPQHVQSSTSSPIVDYIPGAASLLSGNHMPSPVPGPALEPKLSASSSGFASPPSQNNSSTYYTADSSTSHTAGSHGGFTTPGTSSPYSRQTVDSLSTNHTTPDRSSPLLSRRLAGTHRGSPSLAQVSTGVGVNMSDAGMLQQPVAQENGGTTYFYTQKSNQQGMSVVMPPCHVFPGSPPSIEYMSLKANAPSFFMANELRQAIMHKHSLTMLTVDTEQDPSVPAEVDNYHSLFPLEYTPEAPLQKSGTFRYVTTCYKAIKYKDGLPYCVRRIHGFRQVNEKCMVLVDMWKKLQHSNVVQLREVFTSKAFGEHSLIFAHDYYAGAETLMARHFQNPNNNYASKTKWNGGTTRQNAGLLPESLIWTYVVQLTSALRCIHMAGLACRVLDPTKVIITDKSRLRINSVGILDVLAYDNSHANPRAHIQQYQQDDMVSLGKVPYVK
ncbi:unnamed protein product [Clavelina lepadiformis]|uniref:Protein kinase domain-containing protein n=1 Tax=Clavelina lepadiformis TaxID=159417 RepID=A0ABP0G0F9_CLALP